MNELSIEQAFALALQYHQAGHVVEAEGIYAQIIAVQPNHIDALHLLGMARFQRGQAMEGLALVERAMQLQPDTAIFHNNRGQIIESLGRKDEAAEAYRRAIKLDPAYSEAYNNLGNILERQDNLPKAIELYRKAIALNPNYAEPHTNLGNIHKDQGDLDSAIKEYRRAVELRPHLSLLHSNLLLALHYHEGYSSRQLYEEHAAWAQRHVEPLRAEWRPHPNSREPGRRLRIGYVSPDFCNHPVARFMVPLLAHHDRSQVEVTCYADVPLPDEITRRAEQHSDRWRNVANQTDAQLAETIRTDGIDLLVDLTSHTARSRLLVFGRKPAPVQATYLAYSGTTGVRAIDYRISDPYFDPLDSNPAEFAEETFRLPETYWCYSAPELQTQLPDPPPPGDGPPTFGCLNNFCKVTHHTLRAWGQILRAVPQSNLLLYARAGSHRQHVRAVLAGFGVDNRRIRFVARQSLLEYLQTFRQIDVGLDPFPFPGGTTTCDCLWMGTPIVTWAGRTAVSRGGCSILSNVGLPDLVARSEEEYVAKAIALAADRPRRAELRAGLRQRMERSPLMDLPRFARHLENAYRTMWTRWCQSAPAAPTP